MIITIKDNGSGIAQADLPDIFKKYHRLSDVEEGSGVGLYLVNEIISHSGGKTSVESNLAQGSVFRISLKLEPLDSRV